LDPQIEVVDSPRAADVLLVLGHLSGEAMRAAMAVHDAVPPPRGVLVWRPGAGSFGEPNREPSDAQPPGSPFTDTHQISDASRIGPEAIRLRDAVLLGRLASTPDLLPDVDPAPWRGVGPFGQGGTGMTGGVPYGRPLAGRAEDRDGLKLDQLLLRAGPFLPPLPAGLTLDVKLQGDVIQEVAVPSAETAPAALGAAPPFGADRSLFMAALTRPVSIAELELARARHHLAWLAEMLRVMGLTALGRRVLALARRAGPEDLGEVQALARRLRRSRSLGWSLRRVGIMPRDRLAALPGGPIARAAGIAVDARSHDPGYRELGFQPRVEEEGGALARLRQRLQEAQQALELARSAGAAETAPIGTVESPTGPIGGSTSAGVVLLGLLPELLVGMEWGEAVTTIVSLDLDMTDVVSYPAVAPPTEPA